MASVPLHLLRALYKNVIDRDEKTRGREEERKERVWTESKENK